MDILDKLLQEGQRYAEAQAKAKKKAKAAKKAPGDTKPLGPAPIQNPWRDESLVLVMTVQTCKSCGNESTSYTPYVLLERVREYQGKKERHLERITHCDFEIVYGKYPQRIEVLQQETCACPRCFGISNPAGNNLQLSFTFSQENNHVN